MTTLIVTRGLPGSGKTTWAQEWVAQDPEHRARVNRDTLRLMAHDGVHIKQSGPDSGTERAIIHMRDANITALLKRGISVVNDDTNLPLRVVRDLRRLATLAGAEFEIHDMTNVDPLTCATRNFRREGRVPDEVIYDLYSRYIKGQPYPLPVPPERAAKYPMRPYEPVPGTPTAIIVDIDGTVALRGTRDPFDETRVHEDQPNQPVIEVVRALNRAGHRSLFCSGRTEGCIDATAEWLLRHVWAAPGSSLFMRPVGDMRPDAVVKAELFDKHIRDHYNVVAVLDDRNQVVEMWRSMGLTVLQVAEGNF